VWLREVWPEVKRPAGLVPRPVGRDRLLYRTAVRAITFWADTTVVHLLTNGARLKTVPSRLTIAHLHRLITDGARPAGPPPIPRPEPGDPIEVDRLVNGTARSASPSRQHPVGYHFAGRRLTVQLDHGVLQFIAEGVLLRSLPNPLTPAEQARIRDARPAGPPPTLAPEPLRVQRRVSSRDTLMIADNASTSASPTPDAPWPSNPPTTPSASTTAPNYPPRPPARPASRSPASRPQTRTTTPLAPEHTNQLTYPRKIV
jgi:hypothetical protein